MESLTYKEKYNLLLERQKKAELYLDDPQRTEKEIDKWIPLYGEILDSMNYCLRRIGSFTSEEVLNGFKV